MSLAMSRYEIQRILDADLPYAIYKIIDKTEHVGDNQIVCVTTWKNANKILSALEAIDKL